MTFITNIDGKISTDNSTTSILTAGNTFTGTGEDVSRYAFIEVFIKTDANSEPLGVILEFSTDNTNWDFGKSFTHDHKSNPVCIFTSDVLARYFRVSYTTDTTQTVFRLQSRFHISPSNKEPIIIDSKHLDTFGRLRISNPIPLIDGHHIRGKNNFHISESITGSATSTHDADKVMVVLATTGTGDVVRQSRQRGIYQPGSSLLVLFTGVLNSGSNASTVTTRYGYYDDDNGYYFQYNNGTISIVERTKVSGSVVNTVVDQTDWNINELNGNNADLVLDVSKALIFYIQFEWLGVGIVDMGVIINGEYINIHRFKHSNLLTTPYTQMASLPVRCEIISTGGSGSLSQCCYSVINEGKFNPLGELFSANRGATTETIGSTPESVIVIKLKSTGISPKINILIKNISVISTTGANSVLQIYKFQDTAATSILTGSSFVSADSESAVEYDVSSTAITLTNGRLLETRCFSNNADAALVNTDNRNYSITTNVSGVSDLLAVVVNSTGANESYLGAITWLEVI
jgi:hypothetical protein